MLETPSLPSLAHLVAAPRPAVAPGPPLLRLLLPLPFPILLPSTRPTPLQPLLLLLLGCSARPPCTAGTACLPTRCVPCSSACCLPAPPLLRVLRPVRGLLLRLLLSLRLPSCARSVALREQGQEVAQVLCGKNRFCAVLCGFVWFWSCIETRYHVLRVCVVWCCGVLCVVSHVWHGRGVCDVM